MKRFFKLSWRGLPIGIIASVLVAVVVLASVWISVTQTITQEIVGGSPPTAYGSIQAPSYNLDNVEVLGVVSETAEDAVVVVLTAAGVDQYLHLVLTADTLYSAYEVKLTVTAIPGSPGNTSVGDVFLVNIASPTASQQLDGAGIYTFTETIEAIAGSSTGSASVSVLVTLEDAP